MKELADQFFINPVISGSSVFEKLLEFENNSLNHDNGWSTFIDIDSFSGEFIQNADQENCKREDFIKGGFFLILGVKCVYRGLDVLEHSI